jgi:hypothetical protein
MERDEFRMHWRAERPGLKRRVRRNRVTAKYMIDSERGDAQHEVAFDLDCAAHAVEPCAEFVLQPGVDAFRHGSKIKKHVVRVGHVDEFHVLHFFGPLSLARRDNHGRWSRRGRAALLWSWTAAASQAASIRSSR